MWLQLFLSLAIPLAALALSPAGASAARIFPAAPGTNTLLAARDAVRSWRAAGHAREPAIIQLAPGQYSLTEPLVLTVEDGNATWETRDAEITSITGGQRISNFVAKPDGLWHAHTRLRFEQLYVNGHRAVRAHLPVVGFFKIESVRQEDLPDGKARLTIKLPAGERAALGTNASAFRGAQVLVFHKWDTSRYQIEAVNPAAGAFTVEGERMEPWNPWNSDSRFIFDNCDVARPMVPGTWFLDPQGGLSYCPRPGERIGQAEFVAPVVEQFLVIQGASHLHFHGLHFHFAGYQLPPTGCPPTQAAASIAASIQIDDGRDVTFDRCEIAHTGNYGIWFRRGCQDCRI